MDGLLRTLLPSAADLFHTYSASHRTGDCPCKLVKPATASIWTAAQTNDLVSVQGRVAQNPALASKVDAYGYTALHYAAQQNHVAVVAFLLANGCPADANACGATPLHRAAYAGSTEACALLLGAGADVHARDTSFSDHATPLHKAYSAGHAAVAALLRQHGADETAVDGRRQTPAQLLKKKHRAAFGLPVEGDEAREQKAEDLSSSKDASEVVSAPLPPPPPPVAPTKDTFAASVSTDSAAGLECRRCHQRSLTFTRTADGTLLCTACTYLS